MLRKILFRLYLIALIVIWIAYSHDYADLFRRVFD